MLNNTIIDLSYQIALLTENYNNAQAKIQQLEAELKKYKENEVNKNA